MGHFDQTMINIPAEDIGAVGNFKSRTSCKAFRRSVTCTEVYADFLTGAVSLYASYYLYFWLNVGKHVYYPAREVTVAVFVVGILIVLLMGWDGAYRGGISLLRIRETERAIRIPCQALLLIFPLTFFLGRTFSRGVLILAFILLPLLLILQKEVLFFAIRFLHAKGFGVRRVVIYGGGKSGRRILSALLQSSKLGLSPVGIVDDNPGLEGTHIFELNYRRRRSVVVRRGPVTADLLQSCQCDMLVVAIPSFSQERFAETLEAARQAKVEVASLEDQDTSDYFWTESIDIDGLLITSMGDPAPARLYAIAKRAFDILAGSMLVLVLSPLLLLIAIWVRVDSQGPALFVQKRVGRGGKIFKMYKYRSMYTHAPEYSVSPTESVDSRITSVGRFLRRTSLDEIPQIFNVIKGDMSLVGPRPEMPFIVKDYDARQRQRLHVIPGITGLWQLSADRAFHIHENIQYDLYYIRNRSFFMDLAILVHTVFFAMRGV